MGTFTSKQQLGAADILNASSLPGDVVDEERSSGSSVVAARYRSAEERRDLKCQRA